MAKDLFIWKGRKVNSLGDIKAAMLSITEVEEANAFAVAMRSFSSSLYAECTMFMAAMFCDRSEEMARLLTIFFHVQTPDGFFIMEAPQDQYGNTSMATQVMKVRLVRDYDGSPALEILEPSDTASKWSMLSSAYQYLVTEGPARMLSYEEWKEQVAEIERKLDASIGLQP